MTMAQTCTSDLHPALVPAAQLRLACTLAAALLAGCTVGPSYSPPQQAPVVLKQAQASPSFNHDAPVGQWWSQLGDPVLTQLINQALGANQDMRIAMAHVREARAVFVERHLDEAPHVTAQANYARSHEQTVPSDGYRVMSETAELGFDASWELDLFGHQRRATEAAKADLQAEQEDLADVQVTVSAEVARNYFELRGVQQRMAIARSTLSNLTDSQKVIDVRWQLGSGNELDVQRSRARLKEVEASLPLLQISEAQYRHRLAVLLGLRPDALDERLAPRATPAYVKALPLGDTTTLLQRRPDVRAAERRLAAATAQVGVATADLFPRVSVNGFVGFLSGDVSALTGSTGKAWALTPAISWPAFDLGSVRARLRASKAQADVVMAQYQKSVLLALEDTENALTFYARQQSRLVSLSEEADAARRAEALAQARYDQGSEEYLTLLDAQRSRLQADDALAQTQATVNTGVVAVYKALGGTD